MRLIFYLAALLAFSLSLLPAHDNSVDDRVLKATTAGQVDAIRTALVEHIWGVPWKKVLTHQPDQVTANYTPVPEDALPNQVPDVKFIDRLRMTISAPQLSGPPVAHTSSVFIYYPAKPTRHLVVVHQGHGCAFDGSDNSNLDAVIRALVSAHHAVAAIRMPLMQNLKVCREENGDHSHLELMQHKLQKGTPIQFFLEPVARVLNYIQAKHPNYREFDMVGLSGGGWTTTVYSAVDPRIQKSFPVAGTVPLYLRGHNYNDDLEQFTPDLYSIAGYKDLYILGTHGRGRGQSQILNRYDTCCFGEKQHTVAPPPYLDAVNAYANEVEETLQKIGPGTFRLFVSTQAHIHQVPLDGLETVILPEIGGKRADRSAETPSGTRAYH